MAVYIGAPGPFDHQIHKWSSYKTQLEHFLLINDMDNESKQTSCLIAMVDSTTYEILESLTFPKKPAEEKFTELMDLLSRHFEPKRLKIAEQARFWKLKQGPSQSLADFLSDLRKLASTCDDYLADALCTAFVLGLRDDDTPRELLTEATLDLNRALIIVQSMEAANREANTIRSSLGSVDIVKKN